MKNSTINVAALTLGENTPSTRFRVRKLMPQLVENGVVVNEFFSKYGAYPPEGVVNRIKWLPKTAFNSFFRVKQANKFDVCLLQRPLISTLVTFEPFIKAPFVMDVDDAIFSNARGWTTDVIASKANHIICGNTFLAEHYSKYGEVTIIPTAVDVNYFMPNKPNNDNIYIGWSGSSSGFKFLYSIEKELLRVLKHYPKAQLKIVANEYPKFELIPASRITYVKWSEQTEVESIQDFTVGLMPLDNTIQARGKCSYKMLTYMAVGVPVVVSSVGMNDDVMSYGDSGHLVNRQNDWAEAIVAIIDSNKLQIQMGATGRQVVCSHYSNQVIAPKVAKVLKNVY